MPVGIPWALAFVLVAWAGYRRGWGWVTGLSLICLGMVIVDSAIGIGILHSAQTALAGIGAAVVNVFNSVAS